MSIFMGSAESSIDEDSAKSIRALRTGLAARPISANTTDTEDTSVKENNFPDELPIDHAKNWGAAEIISAARGFCTRVESGEVRSVKTYQAFKDALILLDMPYPEPTFENISSDPRDITLALLQEQLKPWQGHNFPDRPSWQPLMGALEEVGETINSWLTETEKVQGIEGDTYTIFAAAAWFGKLAHHHLKLAQNIRGSEEEHVAGMNLSNYAYVAYLNALYNESDLEVNEAMAEHGLPESKDTVADGITDIIVYLADFANAEGIDLSAELNACWKKVRQRDWVKHRQEVAATLTSQSCPHCRHAYHGSDVCLNAASDSDCACSGVD